MHNQEQIVFEFDVSRNVITVHELTFGPRPSLHPTRATSLLNQALALVRAGALFKLELLAEDLLVFYVDDESFSFNSEGRSQIFDAALEQHKVDAILVERGAVQPFMNKFFRDLSAQERAQMTRANVGMLSGYRLPGGVFIPVIVLGDGKRIRFVSFKEVEA